MTSAQYHAIKALARSRGVTSQLEAFAIRLFHCSWDALTEEQAQEFIAYLQRL